MAFQDHFKLNEGYVEIKRGSFRGEDWYEMCYAGSPEECKRVYTLLETVYNMGEHAGRKYVRNAVKEALDIEF